MADSKKPDQVIELFNTAVPTEAEAEKLALEMKKIEEEKTPERRDLTSALRKAVIWIYALSRSADIDPVNTRILARGIDEGSGESIITKEISLQETLDELTSTLDKYDPLPKVLLKKFEDETAEEALKELNSFDDEKKKRVLN